MKQRAAKKPVCQLFVYGTLAPGRSHHDLLRGMTGTWRRGSVAGELHPAGLAATGGYPVIDLERPTTQVAGFLFTSAELADHWQELDTFEGAGYQRVKARVTVDDGSMTDAFVYALARNCR